MTFGVRLALLFRGFTSVAAVTATSAAAYSSLQFEMDAISCLIDNQRWRKSSTFEIFCTLTKRRTSYALIFY